VAKANARNFFTPLGKTPAAASVTPGDQNSNGSPPKGGMPVIACHNREQPWN